MDVFCLQINQQFENEKIWSNSVKNLSVYVPILVLITAVISHLIIMCRINCHIIAPFFPAPFNRPSLQTADSVPSFALWPLCCVWPGNREIIDELFSAASRCANHGVHACVQTNTHIKGHVAFASGWCNVAQRLGMQPTDRPPGYARAVGQIRRKGLASRKKWTT